MFGHKLTKWYPLGTLIKVSNELGPVSLNRYNMFRAATVTGVPATGLSTGDAIKVLEEVSTSALPPGYSYEWTGTAQQQQASGGLVFIILVMAVVFGYLFLVAQYESWTMPVGILLSVTVALFGALVGVAVWGGDINLYTQIGMIMLIGLASKNAILIVEFAMERRASGLSIREAAMEAARQTFSGSYDDCSVISFRGCTPLAGQRCWRCKPTSHRYCSFWRYARRNCSRSYHCASALCINAANARVGQKKAHTASF